MLNLKDCYLCFFRKEKKLKDSTKNFIKSDEKIKVILPSITSVCGIGNDTSECKDYKKIN